MGAFPCGEDEFCVANAKTSIMHILSTYATLNPTLDFTDGVSAEFPEWRFNLRSSNTEPVLRLNAETRGGATLVRENVKEISTLIPDLEQHYRTSLH